MSEHPHCPNHLHQELSSLTVPARPVRVKRFARSGKCRVVPVLVVRNRLFAADRAKPARAARVPRFAAKPALDD
jgi:hypothetical protein